MIISENKSLQSFNTFGIEASVRYFAAFTTTEELRELLAYRAKSHDAQLPLLILGGGSNLLFTGNFHGWVFKNEMMGMELVRRQGNDIDVKAGAGEPWHPFVQHCVANGYAGVENLSLIPGCVGASPMQNIGAYGVEIKEVFHQLEALHIETGEMVTFSVADCAFGYRESAFKRQYKNQFVILNVTYRLSAQPNFNTRYGAIEQELEKMGITELSIAAISQAVINIRSSKLPNPAVMGNAGSFFKNPAIPVAQFEQLKQQYPAIVGYPLPGNEIKMAAGWLIEHCGPQAGVSWKGYRRGDAGCHQHQALVLVNYGHASGADIYQLSADILESVKQTFGVLLEREVNVVGTSLA
jgi:UDP-N-acetylmuramate dehydrogenase